MITPRAGQGTRRDNHSPNRFAFALSLLILFAICVFAGAIKQHAEQTRKPSVRLLHISEYGAAKFQDAFIRAYYDECGGSNGGT